MRAEKYEVISPRVLGASKPWAALFFLDLS